MDHGMERGPRSRQRGIATAEFAISIGVLLSLMLATAELGRVFCEWNILDKSVRDGARYLAGVANNAAGVIDLAQNCPTPANLTIDVCTQNLVVFGNTAGTGQAVLPGFSTGQVTVTVPDAIHVTVTADVPYGSGVPWMFPGGIKPNFYSPGTGATIVPNYTMSAVTIMRAL